MRQNTFINHIRKRSCPRKVICLSAETTSYTPLRLYTSNLGICLKVWEPDKVLLVLVNGRQVVRDDDRLLYTYDPEGVPQCAVGIQFIIQHFAHTRPHFWRNVERMLTTRLAKQAQEQLASESSAELLHPTASAKIWAFTTLISYRS